MYELWNALEKARQYRWVDLSHSLNNDSPYWAGIPDGSVELSKTVDDWGNEMLDCLIQTFNSPASSAPTLISPATSSPRASCPRPTAYSSWSSLCASLTSPKKSKKMSTMPSLYRIFWTTRPNTAPSRTVLLWPCAPTGAGAGPT